MVKEKKYTTQLQAGLGIVEETKILLELWEYGMTSSQLYQKVLDSGHFPNVTARRLLNFVKECFSSRYLIEANYPAWILKRLANEFTTNDFIQLLFLYTARANTILYDFVRMVYWEQYSSGTDNINNDQAKDFVLDANSQGKTKIIWSESTVKRVSTYLTGCCADFSLLESGRKSNRKILPYRISDMVIVFIAYELHFTQLGDNFVISHTDWELFGLSKEDVLEEFRQLSYKGFFIIQSAGDIVRIGWKFNNWEELIDAITKG